MAREPITLLTVGPLPPPPSGATVSFQVFCKEVERNNQSIQLDIIDTSPKQVKRNSSIASVGNLLQAGRIVCEFVRRAAKADAVLIFGSNGFLLSLTPLLVALAKSAGKPCYIRSFGGSLDRFADGLMPVLRGLLLFGLRWADGLMVETQLLHAYFSDILGEKVYYVPAYRPLDHEQQRPTQLDAPKRPDAPLRLAFVGWVRAEKGVFVLLESLRKLNETERRAIRCDIFGPVHPAAQMRFEQEIEETECADYGGVLEPDRVIETLRTYDAFVFPSFYQGEGQPGVVIEAMAAGIPVITTKFRSIPEVVQNRVNGLVVEPQSAKDLYRAIQNIHGDRTLLWEMANQNWDMRKQYDAQQVVPQLLQPILRDLASPPDAMQASVSGD